MAASSKHASRTSGGRIRFLLDGEVQTVEVVDPTRTVLQWLREDRGRTGTKEGCAEGDCGACTVVIAETGVDALRYRAVNACIQFLPTLDGKALITVESLKDRESGVLHPVQQAMVDCHASQCGFCTPGFVMSLFALYQTQAAPDRTAINDALAGNLCRCTGYRPIVDAAKRMVELRPLASAADVIDLVALKRLQRRGMLDVQGRNGRFFAPSSVVEASEVLAEYPSALVLAGGTDVGLWVTKQQRELGDIVYLGNVPELKRINVTADYVEIGAGVSLTDAFAALEPHYPMLSELFRRFASPPIRNAGTLGGNIANGSPIGDSMPALIALGTRIALVSGDARREMPLDALYLGYQKTGLRAGEFIERVLVPLPRHGQLVGAYKISKRFDQDISAVCAGFSMTIEEGLISAVCIAFGGMAATPKRALDCEAALRNHPWTEATCERAAAALASDFTPITDMRATGGYRALVAQNLLRKFFLESSGKLNGAPSRLYDLDRVPA